MEQTRSLKESLEKELVNILTYWLEYVVDYDNGGFFGELSNDNTVNKKAPKGAVLNARILWSFSAGYNHTENSDYLKAAKRSFEYIEKHFIDPTFGGVYWSVDYLGKPYETKNQIYALSFMIYGLAEYYKATQDEQSLDLAKSLFYKIEEYSYDKNRQGYFEAFSREWQELQDFRLSKKDVNEKKTMNTHLHIIEAYSNLYTIWPDKFLKQQIFNLLAVFKTYILNSKTYHLHLFFDEKWESKTSVISYGHDIEASWLLLEVTRTIQDPIAIAEFEKIAVKIAMATQEGLQTDGALIYDYDLQSQIANKELHWWVQAEAMVGFLNAYQITKNDEFYDRFLALWEFVQKHLFNNENGEWYWGLDDKLAILDQESKVSLWKCPYHNTRSCIEIIKRLSS